MVRFKISILLLLILSLLITYLVPANAATPFRVAVLPFNDDSSREYWHGTPDSIGQTVADDFVTALVATERFRVLERERIDVLVFKF